MRGLTCVVLVAALLLVISSSRAAEGPKTLEIGRPAPDFRLPGVDGKEYSLADFAAAKLLVIVFTCNHCPTAQAYEERIKELDADYRSKGVALVAISPNDPLALRVDELGYTDVSDSLEEMKYRAQDHGFKFPYLYDGDKQEVARAYGPMATPHVFIFDQSRKLRYCGRIDDSAKPEQVTSHDARNAIEALLAGKQVPVEKTKTFGCSIKWSEKRAAVQESVERWKQEPVTLQTIDLKGLKELVKNDSNKLRLINVWATWCGPCLAELPDFVTLHHQYRKRDFELVLVSADTAQSENDALKTLQEKLASCRNLRFDGKEYDLVEAIDPKWEGPLPYTILVAPGGKVLYAKQGENDMLKLRRAIVEFLGRVYK